MLLKFKWFSFIFWVSITVSAQFSNYNRGDIINDFSVTDTDGQTYSLYDLLSQGKYVYIDFFATNCGTCQTKISIFNAFYDKYGCNAGDVFCISIEVAGHNNADVVDFEQEFGGTSHHAPAVSNDGGAADVVSDFGVVSFPIICVIAPDKKLLNDNITPVQNVHDIAQSFPRDFNPPAMNCSSDVAYIKADTVKVFPVPVRHTIHITTNEQKALNISIFNLDGSKVYHQKFDSAKNFQLDINLKNGIYVLELKTGISVRYQKIVVIN